MSIRIQTAGIAVLSGTIFLLFLASIALADSAKSEATIHRDEFGVPHIYAAREENGFFALGYAQAQDKLERLLRLYMIVLGRSAELNGAEGLNSDVRVRLWRHVEESRAAYQRLNPQLRKNYAYFVAGIRRYMQDNPAAVPSWAPPLEPFLPVLLERYARWGDVIASGITKCRRASAPISQEVAFIDHEVLHVARASNEWAISPWRTRFGASVLLGDPHGTSFGNRYEFLLRAGPFETMGHTDVGAALPILGHNRHVAWTWTTGAPDLSDCYEIALAPDQKSYLYDGKRIALIRREATIAVKDAPAQKREFFYARRNGVLSPIVARQGGMAYAVSSPYMHSWQRWDEEMYQQNFARSVDEFRQALSLLGHHGENVMAADSRGNTLYVRTGRVPRRPSGYDWSKSVPGNTSKTAWVGTHTIDELVQIKNPPQGYMQNNNVPPAQMMRGSPLTPDRYLPYIYDDYTAPRDSSSSPRFPRGMLATELLASAYSVSEQDVLDIALDRRWPYVSEWQRALAMAAEADVERIRKGSSELRLMLSRLLSFNGVADADSNPALLYYSWLKALETSLSADQLEALIGDVEGHKAVQNPAALVDAVNTAAAAVVKRHGSLDAVLGSAFRAQRGMTDVPIGGPAFRLGTATYTPLRLTYFRTTDAAAAQLAFGGGHALRLVIFTQPLQSYSAVMWGTSDDPASPHYADQLRLLSESRLKRNHFEWRELVPHIRSTLSLNVRPSDLKLLARPVQ